MQVNSNFSNLATVESKNYQWVPSTQFGVDRMMLDRLGAEKSRATTIVRYAPESSFPDHAHPGGEEILVLSGTFSDQSGDFSKGWYLRNPSGTSHAPFSKEGTTIFVKLWQMNSTDKQTVRINTNDPASWSSVKGRAVCKLFQDKNEVTSLQKLTPQEDLFNNVPTLVPAEIFVLSGSVTHLGIEYTKGSWLRLPTQDCARVLASEHGATVYLKLSEFQNITHEVSA